VSNLERSPTVTVAADCRPTAAEPVHELLEAREVDLGEGMPVRRLLPKRERATVGAWCFVDHFGPLEVAGRPGMRVAPHPHIGLQTVTWLVEGEVLHRDSLGNRQPIRPGELNLMTAGRGIAHSEESPPERPPRLHGLQLWTALPSGSSGVAPAFEHHPRLPTVQASGIAVTVLLGELLGRRSPARAFSDLVGADLEVAGAVDQDLPLRPDFEHAVVALSGEAAVGGVSLRPGRLLYLGSDRRRVAVRTAGPARLFLLGGVPFGEPLIVWWNFVAHGADEIARAHADWRSGARFGEVRGFDGPALPAPPLPAGRLRPR
jgi:redox-sensitive bicupin YhaK (pirin superfamily)